MRGRYLVQRTVGVAYLTALDIVLSVWPRARVPHARPLRRMVIGVGGHIGDAIIASSVIPAIRAVAPDIEIGVLVASWSAGLFTGHPEIRRVHVVDHWKLNRAASPLSARFAHWLATSRTAVEEMRSVGYDAAVDLYPFYPGMSLELSRAGIPVRVGYDSGGGGPRRTVRIPWTPGGEHMATRAARVVGYLIPSVEPSPRYDIAPIAEADLTAARILVGPFEADPHVVLHPGTGDPSKEWPLERWVETGRQLAERGYRVAVTGAGARERATARELSEKVPNLLDLSGRTTIAQLRGVLARASVVIACDSAAGHLAAAEGAPVVSLMLGPNEAGPWVPLARRGAVIAGTAATVEAVVSAALSLAEEHA